MVGTWKAVLGSPWRANGGGNAPTKTRIIDTREARPLQASQSQIAQSIVGEGLDVERSSRRLPPARLAPTRRLRADFQLLRCADQPPESARIGLGF